MNSFAQNTSNQEQAIKRFLRDYLNKPKNGQTINMILSGACRYYDADRSYIFELDTARTAVSNTYEFCRDGVSAEADKLQNISLDGMESWFEALEEKGEFYISSISESFDHHSKVYQLLEPQGVTSLAVAPLAANGSVVGFFGVDNPRRNNEHLLLLPLLRQPAAAK